MPPSLPIVDTVVYGLPKLDPATAERTTITIEAERPWTQMPTIQPGEHSVSRRPAGAQQITSRTIAGGVCMENHRVSDVGIARYKGDWDVFARRAG